MKINISIVVTALFLLSSLYSYSSEVEVPVPTQMKILQKMLESERKLQSVSNKDVVIGVLYQSDNKTSDKTKRDIFNNVYSKPIKIGSRNAVFIPIPLQKENIRDTLAKFHKENSLNVLIITQLRSINYKQISNFAVDNGILTISTNS